MKASAVLRVVAGAVMLCTAALGAQSGSSPQLGPRDGAGLPPTDTGRVVPGTAAPDFTLEALAGGTVALSQFRAKKSLVLVFYRGHW